MPTLAVVVAPFENSRNVFEAKHCGRTFSIASMPSALHSLLVPIDAYGIASTWRRSFCFGASSGAPLLGTVGNTTVRTKDDETFGIAFGDHPRVQFLAMMLSCWYFPPGTFRLCPSASISAFCTTSWRANHVG